MLILGLITTAWVVLAILTSMLTPRNTRSVMARVVSAVVQRLAELPLRLFRTYDAQDRWLAGVAPVIVLLQLIVYAIALIVTLGLIVYGSTELTWPQALYQSGATFTTLGIVEPVNDVSAVVTFVAAFLGLVVIAVFIGYLLAIYGAFIGRESLMARLATEAGEPAWGPEILVRGHLLRADPQQVPNCDTWTDWACQVRTGQGVMPVLGHFRSTSSSRHWVVSLLAVLDAAALQCALDPERADAAHVRLLTEGSLTLAILSGAQRASRHNWQTELAIQRALGSNEGTLAGSRLTHEEWTVGSDHLVANGVATGEELEAACGRFSAVRQLYVEPAMLLARKLHAVPAPWSGARVPALPVMFPELASRS